MFMRQRVGTLVFSTLAFLAIMLVVAPEKAVSQEKPAEQKAPARAKREATGPAATKPKRKFRGRLPAYYRVVVDKQQREKIYAIQREYHAQIDALKAQLAALIKERDEKVAAVLTPEQQKKVEQLRQEAKAKRAAKRGKKPTGKGKTASAK